MYARTVDALLAVALLLFAATNVDKLVVLVAFLIDDDYRPAEVLVGHFVGFAVGVTAAVAVAVAAAEWLQAWAFLLGVVPLGLGVWGIVRWRLGREPSDPDTDVLQLVPGSAGRVGVVSVTAIGLNGENLAVYIPFLAGLSPRELALVVVAYAVAAALMFGLALVIARRTVDRGVPDWVDMLLVPIVLVLVGAYVLASGSVLA